MERNNDPIPPTKQMRQLEKYLSKCPSKGESNIPLPPVRTPRNRLSAGSANATNFPKLRRFSGGRGAVSSQVDSCRPSPTDHFPHAIGGLVRRHFLQISLRPVFSSIKDTLYGIVVCQISNALTVNEVNIITRYGYVSWFLLSEGKKLGGEVSVPCVEKLIPPRRGSTGVVLQADLPCSGVDLYKTALFIVFTYGKEEQALEQTRRKDGRCLCHRRVSRTP
ncbi:hypothetical protein CEXT_442831 [Caerostris extrusa]|uniref:Uncharacterized protein n=1 Tax=Caerostris extrusa TaxID=172846 RepID=A0AAV4PCN0_CAEEX|nr:hypothetical protein CEXT_442831 [Caerostris extrusa]